MLVDLAAPLAGKRVTVVAGNHDHGVVGPWLEQLRVEGAELAVDWSGDVAASPLATQLARLLPDSEVGLAYPGLQVRPDVYAFHGHYLDLHMALPRLECVLVRAMARRMLGPDLRFASPGDYERAVGPLYSLSYQLAQGGSRAASRFSNLSRDVWARAHSNGAVSAFLVGRMAVPAGVAALNVTGLGPYTADLTGEGLRRAGLEGIAEVLVNLGVEAEHVIFGHTHRHGPLPGEEQEPGWRAQGGIRLWNTGSWFLESALVGERRAESPYWPGGVIYVHDWGRRSQSTCCATWSSSSFGRPDGRCRCCRRRRPRPQPSPPRTRPPAAGGRAPVAQSSSKSTRHLPSSSCSSLSLARKVRPERPRKPVICLAVRPTPGSSPASRDVRSDSINSVATDTGSDLAAFFFQITKPQPGSSFDQQE